MDSQKLQTVFYCFLAAGLTIPLFNLIIGGIGGAADADVELDADVDADSPLPIPFNLMSLCMASVLFGAAGRICMEFLPGWVSVLIGLAVGAAGGALLLRFVILPLKRNECRAQTIDSLKGREGTVRLEIREDFIGTIAVLSSTGSMVTYDAKPVDHVSIIPVGAPVLVVGVEKRNGRKVCVVMPLS